MTIAPKSTSPIRPLLQATGLDVMSLNVATSSALPAGFSAEVLDSDSSAVEPLRVDGRSVRGWNQWRPRDLYQHHGQDYFKEPFQR